MKRNEKKSLGCGICPYKTNSACHLERHLRIHTGQKPYACDLCSYRATDGGLLKRHKRVHSGEKPFICQICGHKTAQSCSLKDHMAVHTGKKRYSCDFCSFQCSRIGRLRDHQRVHKIKTEFKENFPINEALVPQNESGNSKNDSDHVLQICPHCNLEFSEVLYLDRHVTSVHPETLAKSEPPNQDSCIDEALESSYSCSLCATPQESSEALENHVARHVVYRCLKCKSIFETPDELTAHGNAHTSELLIYDCNFCDFKCKTRNELRGHGRIHSTQQFKCSTCDFESKSAIEFSQHLLTHSLKEMVICNICSQKFEKTEELRVHMVSHYTRVRTRTVKKFNELKQDGSSNKHELGNSYSCFYCSFKCSEERKVEKHIIDVHVPSMHLTKQSEEIEKFTSDSNDESRNDVKMDTNLSPQAGEIQGEQGSSLLNVSGFCPDLASVYQQNNPYLAGFAKSMGQEMFSVANLHSKTYGGCQRLGMPSLSLWNRNSLETKYLAYSFQCGNLQLDSGASGVIQSPDRNPYWSIVQSNQMMYQRFLMGGHLTHNKNQHFESHTNYEHGTAQGRSILNRAGIRLSLDEHASATRIYQSNSTSMDTGGETYQVDNESSQEKKITVRNNWASSDERQLVTIEEWRKIAIKNENSQSLSKLVLEAGSEKLNSSRLTEDLDPSYVSTKPVHNANVGEIRDSDVINENSVSIDGAISVKRSRVEFVEKNDQKLERRVTRSSSRRERKDRLPDTSMETTEMKSSPSSDDILLSKLKKFFNESLPKVNGGAHSSGNFSPQAVNENSTAASSAIFTIDLSSDNESMDSN